MLAKRFTYPSPGFSHYWNYGAGNKMLKKINHVSGKEEIEKFAELLYEYDITGDNVIQELYIKTGYHKANELIDTALEKGIDSVNDAPVCLKQLFKEVDKVPEWLDMDLLNSGSQFCRRVGVFGLIVLRNYCLMGGYESSAINKPLIYTEALKKGAAKRMAETIEFWVNVTGDGAMKPHAIGFNSAVKVRLMHAFARATIMKVPTWDNEVWGVPINQCDMIATNLGFSIIFTEGLRRLGFRPTEREVKGVLHLWKYIGYLLGIPSDQLPDTEEHAIQLIYKWTMFQSPADEDTKALALALKNEPLLASYPKYKWQKKALIKLHLGYNYYFLDNRACQTMGLPKTSFRYLPYLAKCMNAGAEYFNKPRRPFYNSAVKLGRMSQEKIKTAFLSGHASALAQYKH